MTLQCHPRTTGLVHWIGRKKLPIVRCHYFCCPILPSCDRTEICPISLPRSTRNGGVPTVTVTAQNGSVFLDAVRHRMSQKPCPTSVEFQLRCAVSKRYQMSHTDRRQTTDSSVAYDAFILRRSNKCNLAQHCAVLWHGTEFTQKCFNYDYGSNVHISIAPLQTIYVTFVTIWVTGNEWMFSFSPGSNTFKVTWMYT